MPNGQIDPARLEGEALTRWYRRTPAEIEAERDAAASRRYAEFYGRRPHSEAQPRGTTSPASHQSNEASQVTVAARNTRSSPPDAGVHYGKLYAPPADDLAELRRQQAEFGRVMREIDKQNSWFAVPALAPAVAVMALEGAGALAARFAAPRVARGALSFAEREPFARVGDNWATRAGRRAHAALKARVDAKAGWNAEQGVQTESGLVRPDVRAPARNPADQNVRYQMELKPNTPTGRAAGARAAERYTAATGNKTRVIYYNPKDFM